MLDKAAQRGAKVASRRIAARWLLWAIGHGLVWAGGVAALGAIGVLGWWGWSNLQADSARKTLAEHSAAPQARPLPGLDPSTGPGTAAEPGAASIAVVPAAPASAALQLRLDDVELGSSAAAQSPPQAKPIESEPPR
jgi:hypothetical protein